MALKLWLVAFVSFMAFQSMAKADSVYTTVFNVIESFRTKHILILSGVDGRIYRLANNRDNLKLAKSLVGEIVKIDYSVSSDKAFANYVRRIQPNEIDTRTRDLNHFQYNQLRDVAPTDLQSLENVTSIFKKMVTVKDSNYSQCFKRAHMWAFDMWKDQGIKSEKLFIFYTRRYVELEDFKWWFHVAPMVTAGGVEYVLDGTFMDKPMTVEAWKNYFIKSNKITCPVVDKYQDYENKQMSRLCFLMKVPMHYFRPADIEARDKEGAERNQWKLSEIQDARRAFHNYSEVYEGYDNGKRTVTH